jgi:uncharacterized membrane protein YgcG
MIFYENYRCKKGKQKFWRIIPLTSGFILAKRKIRMLVGQILLDEVISLAKEGDYMAVIDQMMSQIESRISGHELLHKLNSGSKEEINHLIEQYGGETVELGAKIVDAYRCLDKLVIRLQHRSQKI